MKCLNCGTELKPQDRFCPHCGATAPEKKITCVNCGGQAEPGQLFCPHCGYRLTQQEDAGPNPEYRQEHREESKERQPELSDKQIAKKACGHIILSFLFDLSLAAIGTFLMAEKESRERYGMDFEEILQLFLVTGLTLWLGGLVFVWSYNKWMKKAMQEKEEGRRMEGIRRANGFLKGAYLYSSAVMMLAVGILFFLS